MKRLLYIAAVCLLMGCARFQTNTSPDLPAFNRVLVVSRLPSIAPQTLDAFLTSFPKAYAVCVVDAGPLMLEQPDTLINRMQQRCQSDVVLTLALNRNYTTGAGEYNSSQAEVLLTLTDNRTQRPLWKSLMTVGVPTRRHTPINPRRIVGQLRNDGVIVGTLPQVMAP